MPKKTSPSMLDHALEYAAAGLPVIPLHGILDDGGCTCGLERCHSPGKHPRTRNGLKDATTDELTIKKWWGDARWPNASIGGVGGTFLCLDIDARHDGFSSLERLVEAHAPLPDTAVAATGDYNGTRGLHYWYRVPAGHPAPGSRTNVREGIDLRCAGGYAVLPPSPHASGVNYEWEVSDISQAAEAPEWILELAPIYVTGDSTWTPDPNFRMSKQVKQFLSGEYQVEPGEQRDFLVAAARSVLATGRSVEMAASLLWEGYEGNGGIEACEWDEDPWTPEDVYALVSDIYSKPPTSPLEKDFSADAFTFDDRGNAERLVASFPERHLIYTPETNIWRVWDVEDRRFNIVSDAWLQVRHADIAGDLAKLAANARSEGEATALMRHAKGSRMLARVNAAVTLAKGLVVEPQRGLDVDPFLFSADNGIIDLRTGDVRDEEPQDLITKRSPVAYDPDAKSQLWEDFLTRVAPDDDLRDYLQLVAGYTLTGSIAEHAFFYLYGRPGSGKSTFLEALQHVMGDYATMASTATFMRDSQRSLGAASEDIARLDGARLVVAHEVEQNDRLATSLVTHITGGDTIAARFLYGPTFEFKPQFKLWIGANHLPKVAGGVRSGIWRRVKILLFDEVIPKNERDGTLARKLKEPETAAAVLAWAIEGAARWHEDVHSKDRILNEPAVVSDAVNVYQRESDHVNAFIDDALEATGDDRNDRVPVGELFAHYLRWCDAEGRDHRETQRGLARKLGDAAFHAKPVRHNDELKRCWIGLKLKDLPGTSGINVKGAKKRKG